uniref:RNase H type-1 domain-containing protein n=1 Tax=Oryza punctata TaxID=4537 RepID=A0A0E0K3H0_ORYPU
MARACASQVPPWSPPPEPGATAHPCASLAARSLLPDVLKLERDVLGSVTRWCAIVLLSDSENQELSVVAPNPTRLLRSWCTPRRATPLGPPLLQLGRTTPQYSNIVEDRPVLYFNALDLVVAVKSMPETYVYHFLDSLSEERVIVPKGLSNSIGTSVTMTSCEHGLRYAPNDYKIPKGECDASFDAKTKKANIAIIIWRDGNVIWSELHKDIDCIDSVHAEAVAMYLLLKRGIDLGLDEFEVCTDCAMIDRVVRGEQEIVHEFNDTDEVRSLFRLIRNIRGRYKLLNCRWVPRESLTFVDAIPRENRLERGTKSAIYTDIVIESSVWKKWLDHMNGVPFHSIKKGNTTIIRRSAAKRPSGVPFKGQERCYLQVTEEEKASTLWHITKALKPSTVHVVIREITTALSKVLSKMESLSSALSCKVKEMGSYKIMYVTGLKPVFRNAKETEELRVIFDPTVFQDGYSSHKKEGLTVILSTLDKMPIIDEMNIDEFSAVSFASFHQALKEGHEDEA